ncbi:MAG: hypothetical protein HS116_05225 [Planctomycetes bacterium]|nr:hypothetical protein [Planctomycetota bacterium]
MARFRANLLVLLSALDMSAEEYAALRIYRQKSAAPKRSKRSEKIREKLNPPMAAGLDSAKSESVTMTA